MDVATVFENLPQTRFMPNINIVIMNVHLKRSSECLTFPIAVVDARTNMSIFSISEKTVRLIKKCSRRFCGVS